MTSRVLSLAVGVAVGITACLGATLLPSTVDWGHCVRLDVNVSTEKAGLVMDLARQYNAAKRSFGGNCARVEVTGKTSGATMRALNQDWTRDVDDVPRPQVWMPTTSLWAGMLTDPNLVLPDERSSITKSPLVIAMPRKMAEALGWPQRGLGWGDLRELANKPDWGARGHPEWGRFEMGKDNPRLSSSGLGATIATHHAATKDIGGITDKNLGNAEVLSFVRNVESSVAHYSDDSVVFMDNLYKEDQKGSAKPYISAMVIQEQMAFLYNNGAPNGDPTKLHNNPPPNHLLVAIHPRDGTMMMDHPFLVLANASDDQRAAADDFREFLLESRQQDQFVEHGFRDANGRTSKVVEDSVGSPPNLSGSTIRPPTPKQIEMMFQDWDANRRRGRVLLLLDVSGSMKEPADITALNSPTKLDLLKPAVQRGMELLDDDDEVALWTFSTNPDFQRLIEMSKVGDVRSAVSEAVANLSPLTETALYNTTLAAHEEMRENLDPKKINTIVLLTDGKNAVNGGVSEQQLLNDIDPTNLETSVRIFTIAYGSDADRATLERIAEKSKARAYDASDPANISQVFASVFSNFGHG